MQGKKMIQKSIALHKRYMNSENKTDVLINSSFILIKITSHSLSGLS